LRAQLLADRLRQQGVTAEQPVAVLCERGLELLVAMLGLWQSGGVYVPIDADYPDERISWILAHSGCGVVLTTRARRRQVEQRLRQAGLARPPLVLAVEDEAEAATSGRWLEAEAGGEGRQLAYIIYTSGSTGKPKGAMIEQRGMVNHLLAKVETLRLRGSDTVAATASTSFDISVWQLMAGLLVGGRVAIVGGEEASEPGRLLEAVRREQVTVLEVVPSMLRVMVEEIESGAAAAGGAGAEEASLRVLMVTGEELEAGLCARWLRRRGGVEVVNAYGPTECSDDVTQEVVELERVERERRVAIGRGLSNTRMYVVGRGGEVAGIGISGEIYVGGEGVGRGYYGDGKQSGERYVPDWLGGGSGERLYRTGDVGRYVGDGRLEYLGRVDQQV
ncbi:MAG TPA: amino acid adenylation domain-containing protein, partial [Blastocatellia bacterium]|nr:amino acid adenylation domain-containing protein [Blastocatellia bacterium]